VSKDFGAILNLNAQKQANSTVQMAVDKSRREKVF
jgi:hypothetical protein